jgi:hypothetical protein
MSDNRVEDVYRCGVCDRDAHDARVLEEAPPGTSREYSQAEFEEHVKLHYDVGRRVVMECYCGRLMGMTPGSSHRLACPHYNCEEVRKFTVS